MRFVLGSILALALLPSPAANAGGDLTLHGPDAPGLKLRPASVRAAGALGVTTVGSNLVLVVNWQGRGNAFARYANVVGPH